MPVRYKVLCWRDNAPHYIRRSNITLSAMRARDLLRPSGLYTSVRACDLILDISAGDSFTDIYGVRRFLFSAISKLVVLLARRPLVLSPQTIGPFERWWTRRIAAMLIQSARNVVTRDTLSTEFVASLMSGKEVVEATDVAFLLPYHRTKRCPDRPIQIGLNISGLLFNGGYSKDNMFTLSVDYPTLARSLVSYFTSLPNCEVHLIGHVNSETHVVEDDYRVALKLAAEFPGSIVAPRFKSPSAAKSYIARLDFFSGSRMHACIAAFSSGVPVLPIAYSRKFAGLFNALGYNRVADCKVQSTDEILHTVITAFEQCDKLKGEISVANRVVANKLAAYESVLKLTLMDVESDRNDSSHEFT